MVRVSIFLIVAALIVGMVGCGSGQYSLAVHSTEGGLGWASGQMTEISNLDYGAVVQLGAVAYTCYEFVSWTGDVGTIADIENAYTTIIMKGSYVITANFAPKVVEAVEIWDWYDLHAVRDNLCWNYTLMNDLDSSTPGYEELAGPTANGGRGWVPIGYSYEISFPFNGVLNGQGYEIRDLFVHRPSELRELGLFGLSYGVIKNIGVVNATVAGGAFNVGALVGDNYGTVCNSYSTGNISGDADYGCVGGLIGQSSGTVSDSYSAASVTGNSRVGGLLGDNYRGTMSNSHYNYDEVLINGENIITRGALFGEDFDEWLADDKFLDINDRLSQESGYYVVNNVADFKQLLAFGENATLKFRLKNDLDLAAEPNFHIPYFAGEFDGNGHRISNLSFDFDFISHIGLFGYLALEGKVSQVCVENVNMTGSGFVGGLVGENDGGTVSNSYSTGNVTAEYLVGGLVGKNNGGTVSNSYSTGSVTGERLIGGLVGENGKFQHESTVSSSYSTSSVSGNENVGGLVGENDYGGTVGDSYSTGSVTGNENVGGLVGHNYWGGTVANSYFSGSVTGDVKVGGLMGYNEGGSVSDCYSIGSVSGNADVGGLVGLAGWNYYYETTVDNSFWDIQTSGQATSDGGTGKNTTQMQDILTFSGAGWDIAAVALNETNPAYIWNIVNNTTYPFLSWQS